MLVECKHFFFQKSLKINQNCASITKKIFAYAKQRQHIHIDMSISNICGDSIASCQVFKTFPNHSAICLLLLFANYHLNYLIRSNSLHKQSIKEHNLHTNRYHKYLHDYLYTRGQINWDRVTRL